MRDGVIAIYSIGSREFMLQTVFRWWKVYCNVITCECLVHWIVVVLKT